MRKSEVIQDVEQVEEETEEDGNKIEVGELKLDLDKYEVKVRGEVIDLTLREFEVLKYLANQPGQVVTRETLLEKVWGYEYYGDIRTVDVTVRRIREKNRKRHIKSKNINYKEKCRLLYSCKIVQKFL